jgi:photosystem II stability/assembly factor-like uncharacterized protein
MKGLSMKTIFKIISAFVLLISSRLYAQDWVKVSPTFEPTGSYNTYYGCFVDEEHGWWVAGPNASVLHTTNGGLYWQEQVNGIALGNIEFKDTLNGWMV